MNPLRFFVTLFTATAAVFFLPDIVTFARNLAPKIPSAPQIASPAGTNSQSGIQANSGEKSDLDQGAQNPVGSSSAQNTQPGIIANHASVFGESGPVTIEQIPPGRFRKQLLSLNESARNVALKRLGDERVPLLDLHSLHLDRDGMLFYTCHPAPELEQQAFSQAPVPSLAPVPISSPPARSSKPGATSVIYLDFNGHTVTGTAWNSSGRASYQCLPFDNDNSPTTFSDSEQAMIIEIWERVAEDFKAFDINVTTVEPETFGPTVARALITKSTDATGANNPSYTAGGVAYKNVFGLSNFHTTYSPAFAYYNKMYNIAGNMAECISHEVGHNLGLSHDGGSTEYYSGHGTGEASWGPIMGASYNKNFTQWSKGDYYRATNKEDDITIIAAKTGYSADDVPADLVGANSINVTSGTFISENHLIGAQTDVDIHRIEITQNSVTINAETFKVPGSSSYGSNLGIQLELLSAAGNLVAAASNQGQSTATITSSVATGTYYIRVTGTGNGSPLATTPTGFNSYASMGAYKLYGTIGSGSGSFAPVVTTGNATSTTLNATTLSATVNPRGLSTGAFFQYGTSESFGFNSASQSAGSGSANATISASLSGLFPSSTYYYRAVAQNSGGTSYGATQSFTTISNSTALQSLTLSNGTLSPVFSSATRNYTASVSHETTSVSANWATLHPSAVAQVRFNTGNFSTTLGGTNSGNFALAVGNNTISIRVTAQDGTSSGNHTLRVVRARSSDTTLSSLSLGAGAFTPAFSISTSNYTLSIPNLISATSINATKVTAGGKIEARVGTGAFVALKSGVASSALTLAPGVNLVQVKVTADNGTTTSSYFFTITRAASGTLLANLIPRWNTSNLTLSPSFSANTSSYSLIVANAVSSLTLLPSLAEANSSAAARVATGNFTAITAGKPSAALALQPGSNSVQLRVLSDDKVTSRVYSLAVDRLTAPASNSVGVVTLSGTILSGMIDARSSSAAFQIGTTAAFGTSLPVSFISGNGMTSVSTSTGALQASTLFYFRITSQYAGITDNGTTGSFLSPVRTSLTPFFRTGGNATGLVAGATFSGFGNPAINFDGDTAFNATAAFTGSNATNNAGIWTVVGGTSRLVARIGTNATGGGVFSALGEPVLDNNGRATFTGSLKVGVGGVATANATGIWRASANGTLALVAKAGAAAPGTTGTILKTFNSLVAGEGGIAFTATLASGSSNVTTSNNTGLWAQNGSGNLVLVARTGASPTPTLTSFSLFNSEAGQTGHSRHFNDTGDLLLLAKFGTGPQGIYRARAYSFTLNGTAPIAAVGSAVPNVTGAVFSVISNPILSQSDEVAFKGTFTGNGITTANNTGLFVYPSSGNGSLLVRTGVADGEGRVFQSISSPILNGAGHLVFTATLKTGVGGVSTANATGVWMVSPLGAISTVARAGDLAPGLSGARFASFSQIACPDEAGITFIATLATGTGGVTASNNTGLWAAPAPGEEPVLVIRVGDSFSVGGVAKTVSAIGVFASSANTAGVARSLNAFGDLILKLTFTDGSSGLFTYP